MRFGTKLDLKRMPLPKDLLLEFVLNEVGNSTDRKFGVLQHGGLRRLPFSKSDPHKKMGSRQLAGSP
jgi:hypothetical protein